MDACATDKSRLLRCRQEIDAPDTGTGRRQFEELLRPARSDLSLQPVECSPAGFDNAKLQNEIVRPLFTLNGVRRDAKLSIPAGAAIIVSATKSVFFIRLPAMERAPQFNRVLEQRQILS